MGVALFAALDGREQLATPPELMARNAMPAAGRQLRCHQRRPRRRNDTHPEKSRPQAARCFNHVQGWRAGRHSFNAVRIRPHRARRCPQHRSCYPLSTRSTCSQKPMRARTRPENRPDLRRKGEERSQSPYRGFPPWRRRNTIQPMILVWMTWKRLSATPAHSLTDGAIQVASLHYVDPLRSGTAERSLYLRSPPCRQNHSGKCQRLSPAVRGAESAGYSEELIPFRSDKDILAALNDAGYENGDATGMSEAIAKLLNSPRLKSGSVLGLGSIPEQYRQDHAGQRL